MAKIVAYAYPAPGHLYPFVPILLELRKRMHRVSIVLPEEGRGPRELAGIHVRVMKWSRPDASDEATRFVAYGEPLAAILDRAIAKERPDLLLIDPTLWGGLIAAEASGFPWASVAHNPMLFRALGVDVRGPGLRPRRGIFGRLWHRVLEAGLRTVESRYSATINAVRAARGLAPLSHRWDLFHLPPLTIATTIEPFEYPRTDWHPTIRFVGPILWDPPSGAASVARQLDDRPLILVTGSSIPEVGKARRWVDMALEALADEPFQVVATLPAGELPQRLPANVRVERFIPHGQLLPYAACVVCHGGPGITQKALAAGVPVVAIPFAYDRFEVARRVEVAGAGVMLPGRRLTPARLKAAVHRAIQCKPGAERVAQAFRQAGGAPAAADAIEDLLGVKTSRNKAYVEAERRIPGSRSADGGF